MPRRAELPNLRPARLDFTHYRGDSLSVRLRMQHQGVPVNVANWSFQAMIREAVDGLEIAQFTVFMDEGNNADPINGIVRLELGYLAAEMLPDKALWDLEGREYSGESVMRVRTLLRGFIYTLSDVTHGTAPVRSGGQAFAVRRR